MYHLSHMEALLKGWQFAVTVIGVGLSILALGGAMLKQFGEQTAELKNNGVAIQRVEAAMNKVGDRVDAIAIAVQGNREANIKQDGRIDAVERAVTVSPTFGRGRVFDK